MEKCIFCNKEITQDNDSKKHIIPNCIGGKLKVRGMVCKNCNSILG